MAPGISQAITHQGTPANSNKDGNFIRILIRRGGMSCPHLSPRSATLTLSNATLLTYAPRGALRRIFRAFDDGLSAATGITKLTALTKAQAREILNSRCASPSTPSVLTTSRTPRARMTIHGCAPPTGLGSAQTVAGATSTGVSSGMAVWSCDASVDASGRPTVVAAAFTFINSRGTALLSNTAANQAAFAFLDIEYCHPITGR